MGKPFADGKEVIDYVRSSRSEFLDAVERSQIFREGQSAIRVTDLLLKFLPTAFSPFGISIPTK